MKKKIGLNGYDYHFSVDSRAISTVDIQDIHKYLMTKNGML